MEKASSFLMSAEGETSVSSIIDASLKKVNVKLLNNRPKIATIFSTKLFFEAGQGVAGFFKQVTLKMTVSYIYKRE